MSQLNGFVNLTQIRKLTQQTLKPIVHEVSRIEEQMGKIKKQSQFLKQQSGKSLIMMQKQKKFEEYMTHYREQMKDVKARLEELDQKDQDLKLMLSTKKQIIFLNEEVTALKRQRAKYEELINKQKKQNQKVLENFNKYQVWMDQKVRNMSEQYLKLKKDTLEMTIDVKSDYQLASAMFKDMQKDIQSKILANDQKYQILQLYLTQRQENKLKILQLQNKFSKYAPIQKIQYLRTCQIKQLQMNKSEINTMLDTYLPPQIKQMLPQIQKHVKQIDRMSTEIHDIKTNVFESQQQINNFKQSTQSLQSNIRKQFKQINQSLTCHIQTLKTDVQLALAIDDKQTEQRKKFQEVFCTRIETFVQKQNQKAYKKVQEQTFQKIQKRQKEQQNKLLQQQESLSKSCKQMRQMSDNIENLFASYNSKIVKIRSDTQLFKNQVLKQLKCMANLKLQNKQRFQDIGCIIATLVEVITLNLTIQMNLDEKSLRLDNFAFSTYNDGLIYQAVPLYAKQGQSNNPSHITYRRSQLEIPHLRRSLLTSMVAFIDKVYQSYPYLQWNTYKPSNFFKDQILHNYLSQLEKYGSVTQNRTRQLSNQNVQNAPGKYNNQSLLFRRSKIYERAYQSTKKQNITNTIGRQFSLKPSDTICNTLEQIGDTANSNADIHVARGQNWFALEQHDKQNIKRAMRTIHQVHPQDSSRFILSGQGNHLSFSKEAHKTINHPPQSAGGSRKRCLQKSKKQPGQNRYHNQTDTFMTSRSSKRTASIGHYKL